MDTRQRFLDVCRFKKVDRPPHWEGTMGFWPQTLERWKREGLPKHLQERTKIEEYFGMEPRPQGFLPVAGATSPLTRLPLDPYFEKKILREDERTVTSLSRYGIICRTFKAKDPTVTPGTEWVENPATDRSDWERIKWRLDADNRRWPNWDELRAKYDLRAFPYPTCIPICGAFGWPRNLFGDYKVLLMYYKDPQLIHDILAHWAEFYKKLCTKIIGNLRVDYVLLWEDMAGKHGPMISPRLFKEFMSPYYRELIDHLKRLGVKVFMVDSDGNVNAILDLFLEAGVNAMMPFEIAAGQDPLKTREKYGDRLAIMGGIDKRVLSCTKEDIKREVMSKVPQLLEGSGYIPCVDHNIPPDVSLENFLYYLELMRELTG